PDGKWLLYQSDESGRDELYVTPFPGPGGAWLVSRNGTTGGAWLRDGQAIAYGTPEVEMVSVDVTFAGGEPHVGRPVPMVGGRRFRTCDITPDGMQAISSVLSGDAALSLTVVTNWRSLVEGK